MKNEVMRDGSSVADSAGVATAANNEQGADILRECGMDGAKWAAAFMRQHGGKAISLVPSNPNSGTVDEADMLAWFCNAIMAGYDEASQRHERTQSAAPELLAALKAHDAYMHDTGYGDPYDMALHPKAAENWERIKDAIRLAEQGQ